MKKYVNILLAAIIAFFTVPITDCTVLADTGGNSLMVPDEAYTIEYDTDSPIVQDYFENPLTLLYKNDIQYIQMNGSSGQLINSLSINGDEVTWGELKDDGTFTVQFELDTALSDELDIGMEMESGASTKEFNVSLSLIENTKQTADTDNHLLLPTDNKTEEANEEDELDAGNTGESDEEGSNSDHAVEQGNEEETESGSSDELKNEERNVSGSRNNADDDLSSNDSNLIPEEKFDESETVYFVTDSDDTNNYFENPATLFTKDGQKYIQMNGTGGQFIKSLTINGEEVKWGAIKSDGTFAIQFELEGALSDELDFGMVIAPPIPGMGEQTFHVSLSFAEELMGSEPDEDEDSTPGNPDETDSSDGSDDDRDTEVIDDKHPALIPEKAFTINYDILKEDGTESISNDLFEKPGLLLEKDNSKYVQITINNGHMVKDLSNKYGDALLVKENTDGLITVQFKVDNDLSDMLLSMRIVVGDDIPGSPGELSPDAVIVFHKDTIEEISVGDHMLVGTNDRDNENGPFIDDDEFAAGSLSSDNPEKPKLGPGQEDNGSSDENGKAEQGSNPKTGDTLNIMLYVLLLVGSAIPLALQLKRRFT